MRMQKVKLKPIRALDRLFTYFLSRAFMANVPGRTGSFTPPAPRMRDETAANQMVGITLTNDESRTVLFFRLFFCRAASWTSFVEG